MTFTSAETSTCIQTVYFNLQGRIAIRVWNYSAAELNYTLDVRSR